MKKYLPVFFIIISLNSSAFSQDGLADFTQNYFHPNPFAGEFSSFLKQLLNNPQIKDKQIRHRTDTSLFYFSGEIAGYRKFFFKPTRVSIALEQIPIKYENETQDTIFIYSLLAFADSTSAGEKDVKKEFAKIHRLFNKRFIESNFQDINSGETKTGGIHNYFVNSIPLAPVTIAWGKAGTNEFALSLVVRLKTESNRAILPVSFDNP